MPIDFTGGKIRNVRALLYKIEGGQRYFLVTYEYSGHYALPGGCKNSEDQSLATAIKREIMEELGLPAYSYRIRESGFSKEYSGVCKDPKSDRYGKNVIFSIYLAEYNGKEAINVGDGIIHTEWFPEEEALGVLSTRHMKELFKLGLERLKD